MSAALTNYNAARAALEKAHTIDEVKDIRDKAEAFRVYAKQAQDTDMQNWAAEIRIRAERRAGALLRGLADSGGRQTGKVPPNRQSPTATVQTLSDLGVTKTQSSKWQQLADVSDPEFETKLREIIGVGKELTTSAMMKAITPANEHEIDYLDELIKRLSPLLPIGADSQPKLAELLKRAIADADPDELKLRSIANMLSEVSIHFAASADALKRRIPVARVA
jgi:hypothetical protein